MLDLWLTPTMIYSIDTGPMITLYRLVTRALRIDALRQNVKNGTLLKFKK
jgi:hypothetical protein